MSYWPSPQLDFPHSRAVRNYLSQAHRALGDIHHASQVGDTALCQNITAQLLHWTVDLLRDLTSNVIVPLAPVYPATSYQGIWAF